MDDFDPTDIVIDATVDGLFAASPRATPEIAVLALAALATELLVTTSNEQVVQRGHIERELLLQAVILPPDRSPLFGAQNIRFAQTAHFMARILDQCTTATENTVSVHTDALGISEALSDQDTISSAMLSTDAGYAFYRRHMNVDYSDMWLLMSTGEMKDNHSLLRFDSFKSQALSTMAKRSNLIVLVVLRVSP